MGYEAAWLDDHPGNSDLIARDSVVFAVGIADTHLPIVKGASYVFHNVSETTISRVESFIKLQVFTFNSTGQELDSPVVIWDKSKRTLFQPWGLPFSHVPFLSPPQNSSRREIWIGAVWNNSRNQGNRATIQEYKSALNERGIKFRRIGGTRWITRNGISEETMRTLINANPVGASIVGEWQLSNGYIPCRFFKNVASGALPSSNSDFFKLLGINGICHRDLGKLIDLVQSTPLGQKRQLVSDAQSKLMPYTYERNIQRILSCLNE